MDACKKYFLTVIKAALTGNCVPCTGDLSEAQWKELAGMAQQHKVLPLFCQATGWPEPLLQLKSTVRRQVALQAVKDRSFHGLCRLLKSRGITFLVVKGMACRGLYPEPELRCSADEDLLVLPEQFEAACAVLEEFGMFSAETDPDAFERSYRMEKDPLYIELHRQLFSPDEEPCRGWNPLFEGVFHHAVPLAGTDMLTMAPTDHLLYLICHALKHFIYSGFGIRQVCDIILFANATGDRVDWDQLRENCRAVHGEVFAAVLFSIGQKYLTLDPAQAGIPADWLAMATDETALLEDMLTGGIYGTATRDRQHSSGMTLAAAADGEGNRKRGTLLRTVFPGSVRLAGSYPYLKKKPWLLPVAWAQRLWKYRKETAAGGSVAAEAVRIGNQRVQLLRQYGVIR